MLSTIVLIIIITFLIGHALLIETYRRWFLKVKPFKPSATIGPSLFFSVIIPARNEEDQIEKCVLSVLKQNYPSHLFEVIVADDYSTDNTATIIQDLQATHSNL